MTNFQNNYFSFDNVQDYEYFYAITVKTDKYDSFKKIVYRGFSFECFNKWKWYFEYRAALEKIKNPRYHIDVF